MHKNDMLMKSKEENDKSHDKIVRSIIDEYNKQAADSQSSYSSDSFRSSVSLANKSRGSYDYSSDEDHIDKKLKNSRRQSRAHGFKPKGPP